MQWFTENELNAYKQSLYVGIIRVMANLVMLGAVFLAMRQAGRWPGWPSEAVFCLIFFGVTIPVWIMAFFLTKWIRRRWPAPAQSVVCLPGLGEQLVTWSVAKNCPSPSPVVVKTLLNSN